MKILLTTSITMLFMLISLNTNTENVKNNREILTEYVIFDGNEGNLYFFTDSGDNAITIEDDENNLFKHFEYDANTYIGETFEIKIKTKYFKNNVGNSTAVLELKLKQ